MYIAHYEYIHLSTKLKLIPIKFKIDINLRLHQTDLTHRFVSATKQLVNGCLLLAFKTIRPQRIPLLIDYIGKSIHVHIDFESGE